MISPDTRELKFVVWTNWVNFQKLASAHDWEVSPCEVSSGFKTELLLCHAPGLGESAHLYKKNYEIHPLAHQH